MLEILRAQVQERRLACLPLRFVDRQGPGVCHRNLFLRDADRPLVIQLDDETRPRHRPPLLLAILEDDALGARSRDVEERILDEARVGTHILRK